MIWILCASAMTILLGLAAAATSASAQQFPRTKAQWQADIGHIRHPGTGCYRASYPAMAWHAIRCVRAPRVPLGPGAGPLPRPRSARQAGPAIVGGGNDYGAQVTGSITSATGTFQNVSSGITEKGDVNTGTVLTANAFTLQLNSQYFADPPACAGSGDPADCEGWQQFVYAYNTPTSGEIFMQYWLVNYDATCPSGFGSPPGGLDPGDCYGNSDAAGVSSLTASQLATVHLSASAVAGDDDGVSLSVGSGQATSVGNSDSKLDLASFWNTTEWGVYGDAYGNEAIFGPGTTLQPLTTLSSTDYAAPACVPGGFTGETNNLSLTSTPALNGGSIPTMASRQTNGTAGTASCSAAAGALPSTPYEVAYQASTASLWSVGASVTNWGTGIMAGTSPAVAALSGGGYELAYQATNGDLWTVGTEGDTNWGLVMKAGTSPAITALTNGSFEVAAQASTGSLWTVGSSDHGSWGLGMMAGTSPAITALASSGYEVAFQANTGALWSAGSAGTANWTLGMDPGTSPAITTLSNGSYEMAFQSNNNQLWSRSSTGANGINWTLGMMAGTSPSLATLSDGSYVMAFQSITTGQLWTRDPTGINGIDWGVNVASGTSPSITG